MRRRNSPPHEEPADEIAHPVPADEEGDRDGVEGDRHDRPRQNPDQSVGGAGVVRDQVHGGAVDEHRLGGMARGEADSFGAHLEQPRFEEARVPLIGHPAGEQHLYRADARKEPQLRQSGDEQRPPGPQSARDHRRHGKQDGQADRLASDGIQHVLREGQQARIEPVQPALGQEQIDVLEGAAWPR